MSRDYVVVWTHDLPTPASMGLGGALLPWPSADRPWPRSEAERKQLGYPNEPTLSRDRELMYSSKTLDRPMSKRVTDALAGREVVRVFTVQNDADLAVRLAAAGDGVCFDEGGDVLYPERKTKAIAKPPAKTKKKPPAKTKTTAEQVPAAVGEPARRSAAVALWVSMNKRPGARCEEIVTAAANGEPTAVEILRAWAPDYYALPNLGVRHMGHDRELCELVLAEARRKPPGLKALIDILALHAYYPAARQPGFEKLAAAANADVAYFMTQAKKDAAVRMQWFKVKEPLD